jgi:hypothetical protein
MAREMPRAVDIVRSKMGGNFHLLTKDEAENEQIVAIIKAYNAGGKPVMIVP